MSILQEVAESSHEMEEAGETVPAEAVALVVKEVQMLLGATTDSLQAMCTRVEEAETKDAVKAAFRQFNRIMKIFMGLASNVTDDHLVRQAICDLGASQLFGDKLSSAALLREVLTAYKTAVARQLGLALRRGREQTTMDEELDDDLLLQFLPDPKLHQAEAVKRSPSRVSGAKRAFSQVTQSRSMARLPMTKSTIPALATIRHFPGVGETVQAEKKNILITREKLRAGLNDPKGLLDLIGSTTNALERTKRLELLKTSGLVNKNQGTRKSFAIKLNEAADQLELGLGALSVNDALTFGAKVLSLPGFLTAKNISEVENNIVEAKTTWKHQDAYCKMIMAGCLNQAKRILQMYDNVLYGDSPEVLVQSTHQKIRDLLHSQDCIAFFNKEGEDNEAHDGKGDDFIKKIVEAVAPVVPITLRDKSLDGTYLRQALHMLGAVELLFAQYQTDVREHSNPAGVVGLASAMHCTFEAATFHGNKLESLEDFMKEMRSQYQTSLGFGSTFSKDAFPGTRRRRSGRGRGFWRNRRFAQQGVMREQVASQGTSSGGYQRLGATHTARIGAGAGRGTVAHDPLACYDYQAGNCRRGASCRFSH